ncbi:hypothetical protein [Clostridium tertium]|uniref:Coenzyme PQQ synthesis protein D (PqqD) n=1 Tax=Clostridium tertium TaxID=1559 RepID=A0A6N3GU72_9CLOT
MRPKIKESMAPIYINNKIVFGTKSTHIEIDDEDGEIFKLLNIINGDLDINEIYKTSSIDNDIIDEVIDVLNENLLIENVELDSNLLSIYEKNRYNTNTVTNF